MLDHAGEALTILVGFWRFVFTGPFRQRKIIEWRQARGSIGGRFAVAAEIVVGLAIGLGLPAVIILVVATTLRGL